MADPIDRATEHYTFLFEKDMEARRKLFDSPSNTHCDECDAEIPEQRRRLGGVKYCVDCQEYLERKRLI